MDREEFIRLAVEALEKQVEKDLSTSSTSGRAGGGLSPSHHQRDDTHLLVRERYETLYDRLTYDYAQLNEGELREILLYVFGHHPTQKNGHIALLKRTFLVVDQDNDRNDTNTRSQVVVASTVMENIQRGSSSVCASGKTKITALWQELFGLHVFFLLSHRDEEICFGKETMQSIMSSYNGLDEAGAWESGRLMEACEQCIMRIVSTWQSEDEAVERFDLVCSILVDVIAKMGNVRSSLVVDVFDMLLRCHDGLPEGGMVVFMRRMFRRRVAYIAASSIVASSYEERNGINSIPYGQMMRILVDVVSPEVAMGDYSRGEHDALCVDTAVCLEYSVGAVMKARLPSMKSSLENILIQKGLYNYCIQRFIRDGCGKAQQQQEGGVATCLVLMACFSSELRRWGMRVPGYVAAWESYFKSDEEKNGAFCTHRVLSVTWDAVIKTSSDVTHGHHPVLTVLHTLFCRDGEAGFFVFVPRDDNNNCTNNNRDTSDEKVSCAALVEQQQLEQRELGNLVQALEVLGRLCAALRYSYPTVDSSSMYQDVMERIDAMRSLCRERQMQAGIRRNKDAPDDDDVKKKETPVFPQTEARPLVDSSSSYRLCDTLLKDLKLILLNTTTSSSSSGMKRE